MKGQLDKYMLYINNLYVKIHGNLILNGINLKIKPGEIHAIMGPNGSGKSTLSNVLTGNPNYEIVSGDIIFEGRNLALQNPEERALGGIFLAFQYPTEIPGVSNAYFLKAMLNAKRKFCGFPELDAIDFFKIVKEKMSILKIEESFLQRNVNEGFSGGEKKKNEALQLLLLEPKLIILDETDSGLDIDSFKIVSTAIDNLKNAFRSFIIVTHYQRLLNCILPNFVHILQNGHIVKTGPRDLAAELEKTGYENSN